MFKCIFLIVENREALIRNTRKFQTVKFDKRPNNYYRFDSFAKTTVFRLGNKMVSVWISKVWKIFRFNIILLNGKHLCDGIETKIFSHPIWIPQTSHSFRRNNDKFFSRTNLSFRYSSEHFFDQQVFNRRMGIYYTKKCKKIPKKGHESVSVCYVSIEEKEPIRFTTGFYFHYFFFN